MTICKCLLIILMLLPAAMGCQTGSKSDSTAVDSTNIQKDTLTLTENSSDSSTLFPETMPSETEAAQYFMQLDAFLVDTPLDTSEFQVITTTCAILVENTQASSKQRQEAEEQEEAERQARRAKMSEAALAQDDSVRQDEEWIMADDGMYYESLKMDGLETLASLNIKMITAQDKGYLKLVGANKKVWVLDIRSSMEQGWTAVLFNTRKEPKVIDLTTVNRDAVVRYFLNE